MVKAIGMKPLAFVVFVCALVACTYAEDAKAEFENKMKASQEVCVKESGVVPELAAKSMNGDFADDEKLKCFMKCMFVKMGYMTDAGAVNEDYMKKHPRPDIGAAEAAAIVDVCKAPAGANACEKAMNLAKCVNEHLK